MGDRPTLTALLRVAFDATPLLHARTGVGQFTNEIVSTLARRGRVDISAFALTWRGRGSLQQSLPSSVTAVARPMPARPLRTAWLRSDAPAVEWWTGPVDVVHGTNFVVPPTRRAAQVVTVHDLTAVRFPELCTPDVLQYPALIERAIARGSWVHTPSEFVANEVVDHFGADRSRVVAIPHGIPGEGSVPERDLDLPARYVLALGTIEPRKGLPALVEAFDRVAADLADLHLVVAGPDGWGVDAYDAAVARAAHRDRIVRFGYVDDSRKAALLAAAQVFAFPSVYEGFGLPPIEAMRHGVPVVTTDAGSLPEVAGDAALLVPVGDVDALAGALRSAVEDGALRESLIERGRRHAAGFTWDAAAARFEELYHQAAAG